MEEMLCSYKTNLYAYDRFLDEVKGNGIALLARNKKEALEFAKEFKGMKVYDRIERRAYDYGNDIMNKQREILKKYFQEGSVTIVEEEEE